ncbi:MAG: hypothetical protein HXS40_11450 [Theionarchaea archaeon]|nr:hypothetical protein [Theionarchaea archaeon]
MSMANLGEVVGAIIGQIGRGRTQADAETVEIAEIYKDYPLFSSFPVPRMVLDEVVIDLKVAISSGPTRGTSLTPQSQKEILERIDTLINDLPNRYRYVQNMPDYPGIWNPARVRITEDIIDLVPVGVAVEPRTIVVGATAAIQQNIMQAIAHPDFKVVTRKSMGSFVEEDIPRMEKYVRSELEKIVEDVVKIQPPPEERLDVLISVSDLESIPSEKISTVRLTLRESDLSWTEIESRKGTFEKKLVPF